MRSIAWFAALVAIWLCGPDARADDASGRELDSLVTSLEAGRAGWFENLEFSSSFGVEIGQALPFKSVKDARFAREGQNLMVEGLLHQKGAWRRFQYDYSEGWQPVDALTVPGRANPAMTLFRYVPGDEVTDGAIYAKYTSRHEIGPAPKHVFGDQLNVEGPDGGLPRFAATWRHPLSYGQSSFNWLFDLSRPIGVDGPGALRRVVKHVDETHVAVRLWRDGPDWSQSRELSFRVGKFGAVVESFKETNITPTGGTSVIETQFLDFRDCPGGPVASRVLEGARAQHAGSKEQRFFLQRWISSDLGRRRPTHADFIITIPETTRITGTNKVPAIVDGKRQFDVGALRDSDLWVTAAPARGRSRVPERLLPSPAN
jgi:hypothetical protein